MYVESKEHTSATQGSTHVWEQSKSMPIAWQYMSSLLILPLVSQVQLQLKSTAKS
jgi:hypothetical protein